jgi:DNA-binding response OmpR family regulator
MPIVMLAEDDETMVSLLKTLLGMEGYQVVALEMDQVISDAVKANKPDVLLLDVHLPTVNGMDVLDQLRADPETETVSVVMTSGLNLEVECMRHGANEFLLKPYMPDDLLGILKRNINSPGRVDS